ncbi:MAG: RNA polymerase sigma factor [Chthoniobacterales bacterium]
MPTVLDATSELASRFATTRWDLVLASAQTQAPGADEALSDLCSTYWPPLYAFVRRRGFSPADAEDLVQGFFAQFLHDRAVKKADPLRGRFRTFLLSSIENFLANEWDRAAAAKRGGDFRFVALDELATEERDTLDPIEATSPEAVFDRRWAQAIVDAALKHLREEADRRGKGKVFEELKSFLTADTTSYENVATRLSLPLAAVKTAIHRLRANFRTIIRREVGRTVSSPTEIEDELRYLSSVLVAANAGELMGN